MKRLGIARVDAAALVGPSDRAGDEGGVNQRAAFDHKPARLELPVDLGQERRREAEPVDRLTKPPDRGVIRRLAVQGDAAEAAERQPVAHRLLGGRVRQRVPLLQQQDLEHRKRRVSRRPRRRSMDRRKQRLDRAPVKRPLDILKDPSALRKACDKSFSKRRLRQVTASHQRITLSETPRESQDSPFCKVL